MFISLIGRVVERIPTIKDLVRRLKQDPDFRWECGFIFSDRTPSEASYSRFIKVLADTNILDELNAKVIETAIVEGFMDGETISIDSTHIEARDAYQAKQDQIDAEPTLPPKKRGRKKKCEREAWVLEKQQEEENLPIYKKTIEKQLDIPLETLVSEMPMAPKWGVKKNSKGKNVFWYGYKGHLAVDSQSQYIVKGFLTSGNINDGKLAIPLMKSIFEKIPFLNVKHFLKDAGYDYEPIYRFALNHQTVPVIDYNKRNETQPEGFDKHFRPICKEGYSYVVDSYDAAYKTIYRG